MSEPAKKQIVKKIIRKQTVKNTTQTNAAQAAAEGGNSPQENAGELQLKLAVFRPVYYYKCENSAGDNETCSICKVKLTEVCNMCSIQKATDCPIEGNSLCNHKFHKHCIESWFQSQTKKLCPLCSANWEPMQN